MCGLCGVVWRVRFFSKCPCVWALWCGVKSLIFSKFPCVWALWCEEFDFFQSAPMCRLCDVESLNFFKVLLCVGFVVWFGEFDFFKVPLCVGAVLWCGKTLNFSDFPGCGYCISMDFPLWWTDCLL